MRVKMSNVIQNVVKTKKEINFALFIPADLQNWFFPMLIVWSIGLYFEIKKIPAGGWQNIASLLLGITASYIKA